MSNSTLVVYHFFQKDQSYIDNLYHFLVFGYSEFVDFIVVVAGKYTIELPMLKNVTYVFSENKNNDYGGYAHALKHEIDVDKYRYYIFVNSSVRGPYIPAYSNKPWTEYFTDMLNDEIMLAGSTINILPNDSPYSIAYQNKYGGSGPFSHVQTMVYALSQEALKYLFKSGFYNIEEDMGKESVIRDYEIHMSQMIISHGWNIACLMPEYNRIDYRRSHSDINPRSINGDPSFPFAYFGRTAHPYELIYIKTNRGVVSLDYLNRLSRSALVNSNVAKLMFHGSVVLQSYAQKVEASLTCLSKDICFEHREKFLKNLYVRFAPKSIQSILSRVYRLLISLL